jgi:dTDP-glucose pyrophosphorylase
MLRIKTIIIHKSLREVYDIVIRLYSNGYNVYTWDKGKDTFIKFKGGIRVCKIERDLSTKKMTLLESYFSCIVDSRCSSEECMIVDDNDDNIRIAKMTGCKIYFIDDTLPSNDIKGTLPSNDIKGIIDTIIYYQNENSGIVKRTMFKKRINIVIPMMGSGLRLNQGMANGLNKEKAYVDIMGKPMISWVIQNLKIDANFIFIVKFDSDIDKLLSSLVPECKIIKCENKTEGQIGSILLAEKYINNDYPLIVANDNQWLDWDIEKMLDTFLFKKVSSLLELITFTSDGNHRYNYVELDDNDNVVLIKQNRPITQLAITDVYFWRHGKDFIRCAHKMTSLNKRIRGEFCTLLVVNELLDEIRDGVSFGKITSSECKSFTTFQDHNDIMQFENYWISGVKNAIDI